MSYFINILLVSITLLILQVVYFKLAKKFNIIDKPNDRSSHKSVTLRGGGIIFLISTWIYFLVAGFEYPWFLTGLTAIALISFIDDVAGVSNRIRLVVHFSAIALLFKQWGILSIEPIWTLIITLVVCVGIINAYNFMDGINGITGAYSIAVLTPLIYINFREPFIDNELLIISFVGVMIFNFFNFRKKAVCFAGDVGAVSIAFILIFVLGKLIIQSENLAYIGLLSVYGADTILTIIHRIILKENIGKAHRKHLYQLLANELKIPHIGVATIYAVVQLIISFGLIILPVSNWLFLFISILLLCIIYVTVKNKYYWMHEEYLKTKKA